MHRSVWGPLSVAGPSGPKCSRSRLVGPLSVHQLRLNITSLLEYIKLNFTVEPLMMGLRWLNKLFSNSHPFFYGEWMVVFIVTCWTFLIAILRLSELLFSCSYRTADDFYPLEGKIYTLYQSPLLCSRKNLCFIVVLPILLLLFLLLCGVASRRNESLWTGCLSAKVLTSMWPALALEWPLLIVNSRLFDVGSICSASITPRLAQCYTYRYLMPRLAMLYRRVPNTNTCAMVCLPIPVCSWFILHFSCLIVKCIPKPFSPVFIQKFKFTCSSSMNQYFRRH